MRTNININLILGGEVPPTRNTFQRGLFVREKDLFKGIVDLRTSYFLRNAGTGMGRG